MADSNGSRSGDHFDGAAEDGEDGRLPRPASTGSRASTTVPCGLPRHPLQVFPAVDSGTLIAPDHDYPSHIELSLTATDSRGLCRHANGHIDPHAVDLAIASNPPGVELTAGPVASRRRSLTAIEGSNVFALGAGDRHAGRQEYRLERLVRRRRPRAIRSSPPSSVTYTAVLRRPDRAGAATGPGAGRRR